MTKIFENSFGQKLNNAQQLATNILSFKDYIELNTNLTIASLNNKTQEVLTYNGEVAKKLQSYSMTIDTKQKIFTKDSDSISKIATPILANVRSIFGKTSKEAKNIGDLVTKIRGVKVAKPTLEETTDTVSQSERSYGNILQTFSDLITTLETFGTKYTPAKAEFSITKLKQKHALASQINTNSTKEHGELKLVREKRNVKYNELSQLCQRLKDTVKAQYGTQSVEYKLIKGLKI